MKKVIIIPVTVCLILFASVIFAAEKQEGSSWFNPSLSVGYTYLGDPNITLTTKQTDLGGVMKIDAKARSVDGFYVAGELPFALTDRFKMTLGGRWTFNSSEGMDERYNGGFVATKIWNSDGRDWATGELLLSYAVIKHFSFLKDLSAVLGFRWDYQRMDFKNPQARVISNSPLDKFEFRMNTYLPVFGLTSTFKGFKYGIFGGDVKLGISGSPFLWGNVDYRETFVTVVGFDFEHNLRRGYFVSPKGEMDLLSVRIAPGFEGKLSATAEYTWFRVRKTGTMEFWGTRYGAPNQSDFEFKIRPKLATMGIKASVAF